MATTKVKTHKRVKKNGVSVVRNHVKRSKQSKANKTVRKLSKSDMADYAKDAKRNHPLFQKRYPKSGTLREALSANGARKKSSIGGYKLDKPGAYKRKLSKKKK